MRTSTKKTVRWDPHVKSALNGSHGEVTGVDDHKSTRQQGADHDAEKVRACRNARANYQRRKTLNAEGTPSQVVTELVAVSRGGETINIAPHLPVRAAGDIDRPPKSRVKEYLERNKPNNKPMEKPPPPKQLAPAAGSAVKRVPVKMPLPPPPKRLALVSGLADVRPVVKPVWEKVDKKPKATSAGVSAVQKTPPPSTISEQIEAVGEVLTVPAPPRFLRDIASAAAKWRFRTAEARRWRERIPCFRFEYRWVQPHEWKKCFSKGISLAAADVRAFWDCPAPARTTDAIGTYPLTSHRLLTCSHWSWAHKSASELSCSDDRWRQFRIIDVPKWVASWPMQIVPGPAIPKVEMDKLRKAYMRNMRLYDGQFNNNSSEPVRFHRSEIKLCRTTAATDSALAYERRCGEISTVGEYINDVNFYEVTGTRKVREFNPVTREFTVLSRYSCVVHVGRVIHRSRTPPVDMCALRETLARGLKLDMKEIRFERAAKFEIAPGKRTHERMVESRIYYRDAKLGLLGRLRKKIFRKYAKNASVDYNENLRLHTRKDVSTGFMSVLYTEDFLLKHGYSRYELVTIDKSLYKHLLRAAAGLDVRKAFWHNHLRTHMRDMPYPEDVKGNTLRRLYTDCLFEQYLDSMNSAATEGGIGSYNL